MQRLWRAYEELRAKVETLERGFPLVPNAAPAAWKCTGCGHSNHRVVVRCLRCRLSRAISDAMPTEGAA